MCFDGAFDGILSAQQLKIQLFINVAFCRKISYIGCKSSTISRYRHLESIEINLNVNLSAFGCELFQMVTISLKH